MKKFQLSLLLCLSVFLIITIVLTNEVSLAQSLLPGSLKNANKLHTTGLTARQPSQLRDFDCGNVNEIPTSECEALKTLFTSTNGSGWTNHENWLENNQPSTWYGVDVKSGHVVGLYLSYNSLLGPIPTNWDSLPNLELIWLQWNQLSGSIPISLKNLPNLWSLALDHNELSGEIPPQLGNIPNLQVLGLDYNHLSGSIPSELGNLIKLENLTLRSNQLTGSIPTELLQLTSLVGLDLSKNQFEGSIPNDIGNLSQLTHLYLHDNQLSGDVPQSITQLVNLCTPDIYDSPCYGQYGLDIGYNRLNIQTIEPITSFLEDKDPDWSLTQAVEETISYATGGTIESIDGNIMVDIPAESIPDDVTFILAPQSSPNHAIGTLIFLGNSFQLTANNLLDEVTSFDSPITIKIYYEEANLGGLPEDSLRLYYWDEDSLNWKDAVLTCTGGEYLRNLTENWFSLDICHLTEFAVVSNPPDLTNNIYMPLIIR